MKTVSPQRQQERAAFAKEAALAFDKDPEMYTYSKGPGIQQGELLAILWNPYTVLICRVAGDFESDSEVELYPSSELIGKDFEPRKAWGWTPKPKESAVGEYTTEEFPVLLDAVDTPESCLRDLVVEVDKRCSGGEMKGTSALARATQNAKVALRKLIFSDVADPSPIEIEPIEKTPLRESYQKKLSKDAKRYPPESVGPKVQSYEHLRDLARLRKSIIYAAGRKPMPAAWALNCPGISKNVTGYSIYIPKKLRK